MVSFQAWSFFEKTYTTTPETLFGIAWHSCVYFQNSRGKFIIQSVPINHFPLGENVIISLSNKFLM